jgi:hypothetical protein
LRMLRARIRFEQELQLLTEKPSQIIPTMMYRGESENVITNEAFYERNPKLRGRALSNKSQQAQWLSIRNKEVRPAVKSPLQSWIVDPVMLAAFASQYEGDSYVPSKATVQFLTQGPVQSAGRSLRDLLLGRWRAGKPPAKLADVYELALLLSGHPGGAMLLCHNVTKAFTRGGRSITWDRNPAAPETYADERKVWQPKVIHKAGRLMMKYVDDYKRTLPSIYYILFSAEELGTDDPGDWYHYFVPAMFTAFDATGAFASPKTGAVRRDPERKIIDVSSADYQAILTDHLAEMEAEMQQGNMLGLPGYRGWLIANAVSFLEGAYYGKNQAEVDRESRLHIQGAFAGLRAAGVKPNPGWVWHVPKAGSVGKVDLATGFSLQLKTKQVLPAIDLIGPGGH